MITLLSPKYYKQIEFLKNSQMGEERKLREKDWLGWCKWEMVRPIYSWGSGTNLQMA